MLVLGPVEAPQAFLPGSTPRLALANKNTIVKIKTRLLQWSDIASPLF